MWITCTPGRDRPRKPSASDIRAVPGVRSAGRQDGFSPPPTGTTEEGTRLCSRGATEQRSRLTTRAGCAFRPQNVGSSCRMVCRQMMRAYRCSRRSSVDPGQRAMNGEPDAGTGAPDRRGRVARHGRRSWRRTSYSGGPQRFGRVTGGWPARYTNAVRRNSGRYRPAGSRI